MKIITTAIVSLLFAGSIFAGCPSKTIKGKVVSFDEESKTLTVAQGKKEKKFKLEAKPKWKVLNAQPNSKKVPVYPSTDVTAKTKLLRK